GQGTPNRHNEYVIVAEVHRLLHDAAAYKAMANAVNSVRRQQSQRALCRCHRCALRPCPERPEDFSPVRAGQAERR
ncbi:MAG TPA: hypothetical protein VHN80_18495, partial [Kineosporiaceae bacterium]|nr:hypothetical protein [Kineosporiaceae bacterium]